MESENKQKIKRQGTKHLLGDVDEKYIKKLIKKSCLNADPKTQIISPHLTSQEKSMNIPLIETYEIGLHVNFQPALIKSFLKIVCKYLYRYSHSILSLHQLILIIAKTTLTTTSQRTLERILSSQELMESINVNIIQKWWENQRDRKIDQKKQSIFQSVNIWQAVSSMFSSNGGMERDMLVYRTTETIQLWADLTMMYQGDYMVLHKFYRELRQKHAPFPSQRERKYFDDLRQLQMNNPIFQDVIIFVLDQEPIISKVDLKKWKIQVRNEENWKAIAACLVLQTCLRLFQENFAQLQAEKKRDNLQDDETEKTIPIQILCDNLKQRIQYLFNFVMNYRSRYAHQIKNKQNKFIIEEHSHSYQILCEKLKDQKALMDKLDLAPVVLPLDRQSLIFVNQYDEEILQNEDDLEYTSKSKRQIINLGNISAQSQQTQRADAPSGEQITDNKNSVYQKIGDDIEKGTQGSFALKNFNFI